jgi:hypothetical protein
VLHTFKVRRSFVTKRVMSRINVKCRHVYHARSALAFSYITSSIMCRICSCGCILSFGVPNICVAPLHVTAHELWRTYAFYRLIEWSMHCFRSTKLTFSAVKATAKCSINPHFLSSTKELCFYYYYYYYYYYYSYYWLQLTYHSVAVVLTLVQTKQIRINKIN